MKIKLIQRLNPLFWFGNLDDPIPPSWYKPNSSYWWRLTSWYIRNPLHNFCFYVIGLADKPQYRQPDKVFNAETKWNIIFPFVSYSGKKWRWYVGWREKNNFGIKFVRIQ